MIIALMLTLIRTNDHFHRVLLRGGGVDYMDSCARARLHVLLNIWIAFARQKTWNMVNSEV